MSATVSQNKTSSSPRQRPVVTVQPDNAHNQMDGTATANSGGEATPPLPTLSLSDLVSDLESNLDMFMETIKKYWDVKMSKDTVFMFGGMEGHYKEMIASIERDMSQP